MCTSLLYRDASNRAYLGRTLELSLELPYQIAFYPHAQAFISAVDGYPALKWQGRQSFVAVTMPAVLAAPGTPLTPSDLKVVEGLNDAGLTFSMQSYPQAAGPDVPEGSQAVLSAADLGAWVLSQFSSAAEVKAAITAQPIVLPPIPILGGLRVPFHFTVHDTSGQSLVIEFHQGTLTLYDNPVGVMTNAPQFSWHLTNLNNYTFLTNVDHSTATFGSYNAVQPGSGIAKAGLPGADTSVDRFIRAAFYAQFAEKQTDPDTAVQIVAHIMNNFDRPRGITVDYPGKGSGHLAVDGVKLTSIPTEFTSWTNISDLTRRLFFIRDSRGMNYTCIALAELAQSGFRVMPMAHLMPSVQNATATLAAA